MEIIKEIRNICNENKLEFINFTLYYEDMNSMAVMNRKIVKFPLINFFYKKYSKQYKYHSFVYSDKKSFCDINMDIDTEHYLHYLFRLLHNDYYSELSIRKIKI